LESFLGWCGGAAEETGSFGAKEIGGGLDLAAGREYHYLGLGDYIETNVNKRMGDNLWLRLV